MLNQLIYDNLNLFYLYVANSVFKIRKVYPFVNINNYEDGGLSAKTANLMV